MRFLAPILMASTMCCVTPQPAAKPPVNIDQAILDVDFGVMTIRFQPPSPHYPEAAKAQGIQGRVTVVFIVDERGETVSSKAIDGPAELHQTAEQYGLQWKFKPSIINGRPRAVRFQLVMPFVLH
ncbi:energy transducer TonB [Mesoterricola silvestris]|uniref:energy transducer TonB n=1 Tax=Mesoterricola silvestris TaxID=2927979 RepID=UPI00292D0AFA|nr:energy transducer TonB [Mesoterricola silvestris]